jgi:hypothetical protein
MRSFIVGVLLAVLVSPAFANHHRAHTLFFTRDLWPRIAQLSSRDIPELRKVTELSPLAEQRIRQIELMVAETLIVIEELETKIYSESCTVDESLDVLETARGMVNGPKKGSPGLASNGKQLAGQAGRISYRMGQLLGALIEADELDDVNLDVLARMQRRHADAWIQVDNVIWHVNDAFREEVAGIAGAGHDPEVDPAGFGQDFIFDPCPNGT